MLDIRSQKKGKNLVYDIDKVVTQLYLQMIQNCHYTKIIKTISFYQKNVKIDWSHWRLNGFTFFCRVKRSDGHLGCSRGYNSMEYKADQIEGFYTQGREQTHSLLQKVESSFRQMNYQRSGFEIF